MPVPSYRGAGPEAAAGAEAALAGKVNGPFCPQPTDVSADRPITDAMISPPGWRPRCAGHNARRAVPVTTLENIRIARSYPS